MKIFCKPIIMILIIILCSYNPTLIKEDKQLALLAASAEKITIAELLLKEHPIPQVIMFLL